METHPLILQNKGTVRLSHSTLGLLHSCERKFQLSRLLDANDTRDETSSTTFGTAYGIGVADYFVHQNQDQAVYRCWMAYNEEYQDSKKNMLKSLVALRKSFALIDKLLEEYEVAVFNGKPAVELSFCIYIDGVYYFVGYIDLVLRHKATGVYYIVDAKTTGLALDNLDVLYRYDTQLLGYSIVLDAIAGENLASYSVMYFSAKIARDWYPVVRPYVYNRTLMDRLDWFATLDMDVDKLRHMAKHDLYPKRKTSCNAWNRVCPHFQYCGLHDAFPPKIMPVDDVEYDFYFNLDELVQTHIERVQAL